MRLRIGKRRTKDRERETRSEERWRREAERDDGRKKKQEAIPPVYLMSDK